MTAKRKRSPDTRGGDRHRRAPVAVRFPEDVAEALAARVDAEKRPQNAIIVDAVRVYLKKPLDGGSATG